MMKISVFCEKNSNNLDIISDVNLQNIASEMLDFALKEINSAIFSFDNNYEFEVLLTDNEFIHQINKQYRQKDCPTDVITFALYVDSEQKIIVDNTIQLGQIIISLDKVTEQANENNLTNEAELLNLLSHGVLHLLGIDHPDETSLSCMLNLQNKMIESIKNVKI